MVAGGRPSENRCSGLVSGNPADGNFAVYHYLDKLLCAVENINRPGQHMLARKMLKDNFSPTEAQVMQGVDEIKVALASWEAAPPCILVRARGAQARARGPARE